MHAYVCTCVCVCTDGYVRNTCGSIILCDIETYSFAPQFFWYLGKQKTNVNFLTLGSSD